MTTLAARKDAVVLGCRVGIAAGVDPEGRFRKAAELAGALREASGNRGPLGAALCLSPGAARELLFSGRCADLAGRLRDAGLVAAAIDGSAGGAAGWNQSSRLDYTVDLIGIAQEIASPGGEVGISTIPVSRRPGFAEPGLQEAAARRLAQAAGVIFLVQQESGASIHLDLVPEPLHFLETARDVVAFFRDHMLTHGADELCRRMHFSESGATDILMNNLRVGYDTCHAAAVFEDPEDAFRSYASAGIRIGKVRTGAILRFACGAGEGPSDADPVKALARLPGNGRPRPVIGRRDSIKVVFEDAGDALRAWDGCAPSGEYRVLRRVPSFLERAFGMATTKEHVGKVLEIARERYVTSYWEAGADDGERQELLWIDGRLRRAAGSLPPEGRGGAPLSGAARR